MVLTAIHTNEEYELLTLTDTTESNIRAYIRAWLKSRGADISSEWSTSAGPIDLYLKNQRVIIETKTPSRLKNGPDAPNTGSGKHNTASEQVEAYVKAERRRERLYLEDDIENLPWLGVVTDGRKWWVWEWPPAGRGDARSVRDAWQGTTLTRTNLDTLSSMFDRKIGLDWAPDDPTGLFDDHLATLKELYQMEAGKPSLDTMKELWLRQLRASGNAPQTEHDTDDLFVLHTLLITVAATITSSISGKPTKLGFAAWVNDTQWLHAVLETIQQYNWRQGTGDVLRALYMGLVDSRHRKIYGEFYTPDWLAEMLCREVLDDKWIERRVRDHFEGKYSGVLDPACGSGTFLYHAARRIAESKPVQNSSMRPDEVAEMLVQLVNGIDIHPVAVEMARANLLRALPAIPNGGMRVWQGDSLQTDRKDAGTMKLFEDTDTLTIYSRKDRVIHLPKSFLSRWTAINDVERLVESADDGRPFPPGLDAELESMDAETLRQTHHTLTEICRDEGNSVWAWHIINQAGPYLLMKEKISRIVANPPWVRLSNIQDETRKEEMIRVAKEQKIWVGGKNAGGFDIASLFVVKCSELYMHDGTKSGWILPQAALRGGNWDGYRNVMEGRLAESWDLDNLPFPTQSKSCANILGRAKKTKWRKLAKKAPGKIPHDADWDVAKAKIKWVPGPKEFPTQPSKWHSDNDVSIRMGATLRPYCLVKISEKKDVVDGAQITTIPSRQKPWKMLGSKSGIVPKRWVRYVITQDELLPYTTTKSSQFIIPLDETLTNFDKDMMNCQYWRDVDGMYQKHMGKGATTPKTLLDRINHHRTLEKQIIRKSKHLVAYNKAGMWLHAAVIKPEDIINSSVYTVSSKTKNESLFLTALLNADSIQEAYQNSRKSDRDFETHFWKVVPLPRYDSSNDSHKKLAKLAARAAKVAVSCPKQNRKVIREFLREDGVAGEIDEVIKELLPEYTS